MASSVKSGPDALCGSRQLDEQLEHLRRYLDLAADDGAELGPWLDEARARLDHLQEA